MRQETTQSKPSDEIAAPAPLAIHVMMPDFARAEASVIKEPIQNIASHAPFSWMTSCQLMMSSISMRQTAPMATGVASMCVRPELAQSTRETTKMTERPFSARLIGPISISSRCASPLASGIRTSSGGESFIMT